MATIKEEDDIRKKLLETLSIIHAINPEDLIQTERLGSDLDFKEGLEYFNRGISLFNMLHDLNLERVPFTPLNLVFTDSGKIIELIQKIKSFKASDSNPINTRNSYINEFNIHYDTWFTHISPIIAFCIRSGTDFELLQNKAQNALAQVHAIQEETREKSNELLEKTNVTLEKVRNAAAEVGVAQHATHFQTEANEYKESSKTWFFGLIASAIITALWGFFSFAFMPLAQSELGNNYSQFIQVFAARMSVFMILIFLLFWCSKNYAAHRHNFVINKHRQNALGTFETFAKAAGDDIQTKNAVLLQATQSIFSSQPSGFISKSNDQDSSSKVIEIVKDISKLSK